jgi:YD repeat-containing protein
MTVYQYDDRENLLSVTDPADGVTTFAYDPYGRLQSATDAVGGDVPSFPNFSPTSSES